jgi:tryptophanyl-tRNA synthetase
VNVRNLIKWGGATTCWSQAAGPGSNLLLAVLASIAWAADRVADALGEPNVSAPLASLCSTRDSTNVLLAVFNMIPIPPLDGGNVSRRIAAALDRREIRCADASLRIHPVVRFAADERLRLPRRSSGAISLVVASVMSTAAPLAGPAYWTCRVRHAADRSTAPRSSGRALSNWARLQAEHDCFYFVADWHALTSDYADTKRLTEYVYENVADWIGAGLDPDKSTLFVQSLVPEHAELYLLLSMVVPVPWLERVPTYKEQQETLKDKDLSSIGFLGYPLLQTADVAIYDAELVPVGEDQVAHLELAREVVRRFNNFFGDPLVEPQPLLTTFARLPGLDGDKKMSKSLGNTIHLSDSADAVKKKVMQMYTDPKRVRADIPAPSRAIRCSSITTPSIRTRRSRGPEDALSLGKVGDVEVKTKLANALNAHLDPIRERRAACSPSRIS